jgi:2-phosphoglycerate kinase
MVGNMVVSIRFEDRLDGISNYLQWKVQMSTILKENKIWNYVGSVVVVPTTDLVALDLNEIKEAKVQRIILDGVKDHLIPHLAEKKTAKEMWDALKNLFVAKNENRKMALKAKLHDTKMGKEESVSYLTRVAQVKDELVVVGEVISNSELVRIALKGFTKEWEIFVKCVVGPEHLPDWSRLWDDFT